MATGKTKTAKRPAAKKVNKPPTNKPVSHAKPQQVKKKLVKTKTVHNEVGGIVIIALSIFIFFTLFTSTMGVVGDFIKNLLTGLFGIASYFGCFLLLFVGIVQFKSEKGSKSAYKYWLGFGLQLMVSVIVALTFIDYIQGTFDPFILFDWGRAGNGGGVFGSMIANILLEYTGVAGAWIISLALTLILAVILTGISIEAFVKAVYRKVKNGTQSVKEAMQREHEIPITEKDEEWEKEKPKEIKKAPSFFDSYFEDEGDINTTPAEDVLESEPTESSGERIEVFDYDDTSKTSRNSPNSLGEEDSPKPARFVLPKMEGGILSKPPDENGEFKKPTENEEGTDFEPPSEVQIKERLDHNTQKAIDSGVSMDQAVTAGKRHARNAVKETLNITTENPVIHDYTYPDLSLLAKPTMISKTKTIAARRELENKANKLLDTLRSFGVEASIINVSQGPTVTRFELQPGLGVKVNKITNLSDDIALSLAAMGVRIEAPIPGKSAIGIEIPNATPGSVPVREVIDTETFRNFPSKTAFAVGKDISGTSIVADIGTFPHVLIAGATGSGKSVCINTIITSILFKAKPNEVKLIMVDPKMVELGVYNGIPHLLIPVVTDPKRAAGALNWAVLEMKNRYKLFADNNVRNLQGFNNLMKENKLYDNLLPEIVIIIDELADLMMVAKNEVEDAINSLAALARAAGMYLVIATQRPSVDVITGVIKANVPSRISFAVSSQIDSRTILDTPGAEKLLGKGDMLYFPRGESKPIRIQGNFVSDKEVEKIVEFIKRQYTATYNEDVLEQLEKAHEGQKDDDITGKAGDADELLPQVIEMAVNSGQASITMVMRKFKIGHNRAARLIDQMEERGIISAQDSTKPRQVLITKSELNEMMNVNDAYTGD